MTPEDLIQDIRAYAHAGDQDAGHRVVRALFAPRFGELQARWRDVCAYAVCLDLDDVARLMRDANYELAHRAILNPRQRRVFLFTPDQIRAIHDAAYEVAVKQMPTRFTLASGSLIALDPPEDPTLFVKHRAFVMALRQRLWMHGGKP